MRFKVELLLKNGRIVTEIMFAETVTELDEMIAKKFKTCKVLSIIGGGQ